MYAVIWQMFDGYLSGVGAWLANFLQQVLLVSWMEIGPEAEERENRIVCHGFGDLVARFIRRVKINLVTSVCVCPAVAGDYDAHYFYYVINTDEGIRIQVDGLSDGDHNTTVDMISERLTVEMSVDKFVGLCGSRYVAILSQST